MRMSQQYSAKTLSSLTELIRQQQLPDEFIESVDRCYWPLAMALNRASLPNKTMLVGVQGSQGSGKTTLARFIQLILEQEFGRRALVLSIDDFYLSKQSRQLLAESTHPLFATRGVPGTHDIDLLHDVFNQIRSRQLSLQPIHLPVFDKALDDRRPVADFRRIDVRPDIVLFEGWCVGLKPQPLAELTKPINELEAKRDQGARWRTAVNRQLQNKYAALFQQLDQLVYLRIPSFEAVYDWRLLQEQKLFAKRATIGESTALVQSKQQIKAFIQYFERLTMHALRTCPNYADWIIDLDVDHRLTGLHQKPSNQMGR